MSTGGGPLLHHRPRSGWLNDPNGLVVHDGEWHLCYQHHPASVDQGPMHWGHAVSRDLITWTELPLALRPDALGEAFSGSAVVDRRGTAGFGAGALVAMFTRWTETSQVQSLAGSTDGGRTWRAHPDNPVLAQPRGVRDFRDPKVVWYGDADGGHWLMVLAAGDAVRCYASPDLVTWEATGIFAPERGRPHGVWETPDLFALPVDGGADRWVLSVGAAEHGPAGGSGTRYWTGRCDGATFVADGPARWADHGADFYAAQSWSDAPDARRVWIAWMSNWRYAGDVPAAGWRGRMTLPRQLALTDDGGDGPVLVQRPVPELSRHLDDATALRDAPAVLDDGAGTVGLRIGAATRGRVGLELGAGGACVRVVADLGDGMLTVDRTRAAGGVGHGFAAAHHARLRTRDRALDVDVVVDQGSVEVIADGGRVCVTDLAPDLVGPVTVGLRCTPGLEVDASLRPVRTADAA